MEIKRKINNWDLIKLNRFCIAKETTNKVKRQPWECEKIVVNETTDKELISKLYKQLISQYQKKKKKQLNQKVGKRPKKNTFSKEDIQVANKHMKRSSTLLIIREMQIKTTMRYHLTPLRMAITKKSISNKCRRECGEKGMLLHCWWECKLIQPLWKRVWKFL